jgi:hypothetical protein
MGGRAGRPDRDNRPKSNGRWCDASVASEKDSPVARVGAGAPRDKPASLLGYDADMDEPKNAWLRVRRAVTILWLANIAGGVAMVLVGTPLAIALGRPWDHTATLLEVWCFAAAIFLGVVFLPRKEETRPPDSPDP